MAISEGEANAINNQNPYNQNLKLGTQIRDLQLQKEELIKNNAILEKIVKDLRMQTETKEDKLDDRKTKIEIKDGSTGKEKQAKRNERRSEKRKEKE